MFQTHYRQRLDLTDEALAGAQAAARRLGEFGRRLRGAVGDQDDSEFAALAGRLRTDFSEALNDDLNAPRAVAALFDFVSKANRLLDSGRVPGPGAWETWLLTDGVLGAATEPQILEVQAAVVRVTAITPTLVRGAEDTPPDEPAEREAWAQEWARLRGEAKRRRDFAEADRIRQLLLDHGFELRDRKDGTAEILKR
jgi:cysteinyl-tRNA synthetase